jgi:hypothetical protein
MLVRTDEPATVTGAPTPPATVVRSIGLEQEMCCALKSGGKPTFPTLRLLDLLDCFYVASSPTNITNYSEHLRAGKVYRQEVGLPPLSLCAGEIFVQSLMNGCDDRKSKNAAEVNE